MLVMNGLFDLKAGETLGSFKPFYQDFAKHLLDKELITSWQLLYRQQHPGFNLEAPSQHGLVKMCFKDLDHANACWDYVEADLEPLKSKHRGVNTRVENISFFLSEEIESDCD